MKILLDECVTKHLKPHLKEHEVLTAREMKWSGVKNGKLISLCAEHGFDILLTIDKNLQYQQNLHLYPLITVILNSYTSKLEELVLFLPAFHTRLSSFENIRHISWTNEHTTFSPEQKFGTHHILIN